MAPSSSQARLHDEMDCLQEIITSVAESPAIQADAGTMSLFEHLKTRLQAFAALLSDCTGNMEAESHALQEAMLSVSELKELLRLQVKDQVKNLFLESLHQQVESRDGVGLQAVRDAVAGLGPVWDQKHGEVEKGIGNVDAKLDTVASNVLSQFGDIQTKVLTRIDEVNKRIDNVQTKLNSVAHKETLDKVASEVLSMQHGLQANGAVLQDAVGELTVGLQDVSDKLEAREDLYADQRDDVREIRHVVETEKHGLKRKILDLTARQDGFYREIQVLNDENQRLEANVDALTSSNAHLEHVLGCKTGKITELEGLADQQASRIAELDAQVTALHSSAAQDAGRVSELLRDKAMLEADKQSLSLQVAEVTVQLEAKGEQCVRLEDQRASLVSERDGMVTDLALLQQQLCHAAQSVEAAESKRESIQTEMNSRHDEIGGLRQALADARLVAARCQGHQHLENWNADLRLQRQKMEEELSNLRHRLVSGEAQLSELRDENSGLRGDLEKLHAAASEHEASVRELRDRVGSGGPGVVGTGLGGEISALRIAVEDHDTALLGQVAAHQATIDMAPNNLNYFKSNQIKAT
ncbi:hypothetical protein QBC41DRAFT_372938 [Cercophora samala]|uniref:Uncharacterized protein n=1 Tax=Cercophora samala TaxID=330535 RepID=A0AA39ZEY8_9PEZI|nr:hypothetical protein QBC41DRAFT_372938 [Cercophora samala]